MRRFAYMAIGGVTGIVILKLLIALIFPLFGIVAGTITSVVKIALVAGAVALIWCLCKRCCRNEADSC